MKQIEGKISMNLVGCETEFSFEMEDDATPDEIREAVEEEVWQNVNYHYTIDGEDPE